MSMSCPGVCHGLTNVVMNGTKEYAYLLWTQIRKRIGSIMSRYSLFVGPRQDSIRFLKCVKGEISDLVF